MNNRGQIDVMTFMVIFIGVITALILYQGIQPFIGITRNTEHVANGTYTVANGSVVDLVGQELLSAAIVTNATTESVGNKSLIAAGNYTLDEGVSTTSGQKTIRFEWTADSELAGHNPINVTYDYGADGYADDAGARAIIPLIAIFSALAIIVFTLSPVMRSGIMDQIGKI